MTIFKILSHNRRVQVFKFQETRNVNFMIAKSSSIRTEKKRTFVNNIFLNLIRERNSTEKKSANFKNK